MMLQLWHQGAVRKAKGNEYPSLSRSGLAQRGKTNGRGARLDELEQIKAGFVRSARNAQRVGAGGVEVHAAHGYGIDLFLWEETNRRDDGYGGDLTARLRFSAEIVAAIREATGPEFIISFRFPQWKEVDFDARIVHTPGELQILLSGLRAAGVDLFHVSTRRFSAPEWKDSLLGLAGWCKALTDVPVIAVGSVGLDVDVMTNLVSDTEAKSSGVPALRELGHRFDNGEFDLVAIGRSLIGDPDWVEKVEAGCYESIRTFTKQSLFGGIDWDLSFVADAHGVAQGEGSLLGPVP